MALKPPIVYTGMPKIMKSEIIVLDKSGLQGDFVHELLLEKRVIPILPLTIVARGKPKSKLSGLKSDLVENFLEMIEDDFFIAKDLSFTKKSKGGNHYFPPT